MIVWITALDGSINFKAEAADTDEAFEKLGRSLGYTGYEPMCIDLGYNTSDFTLATIGFESAEYDEHGNRKLINRERDNLVTSAFKHLRRLGRG